MKQGIVYLVGAGPGDPDLITVGGMQALQRADVVLYDRLVNPALLEYVPSHAEKIFVGKAAWNHALDQAQINERLVTYAQAGKTVVRLKGGDPFVFGRGGEEVEACAAAGVACRIISGVSSALAVPAHAGIPLTHRELSSAFAVVTGHRGDESAGTVDWAALAHIDTLVILMGIENLAEIVAELLSNGRSCETPVAIIERGTTPEERVLIGTLRDIAESALAMGVRAPAVIVVGEVVNLREAVALEGAVGR